MTKGQLRPAVYWACNACLKSKRAALADEAAQSHGFGLVYHAYDDEERTCHDCGGAFTFTKGEQQYWYEVLRFATYSRPIRCPDCRRSEPTNPSVKT